jgi:tetratricopeptide (TPR) repeat protein
LFSIHPINIQETVWISGRNYITAAILTLLMFLFPKVSVLFYYFASYFAVSHWFAPLYFIFTPYWYLIFMIPAIFFLTKRNRRVLKIKMWETNVKTTNFEMRKIKPAKIIPFLKTFGYYFLLCIFPFVVGIDHQFLYGFGTNKTDNKKGYEFDKYLAGGLICALLPFIAYFTGFKGVAMGLFWFAFNIAMWCNFVTIQQQVSQRYTYLACIGMMYAISCLIINYPLVITVFITAYLVRLWYTMPILINDYWATLGTKHEMKGFHYEWLMSGVKKFCFKNFPGALADFQEAYRCKPYDFKVLFNLANTFFVLGNLPEAKKFLALSKENIYDEMEEDAVPYIEKFDEYLKEQEKTWKPGIMVQIDLNRIMVVK